MKLVVLCHSHTLANELINYLAKMQSNLDIKNIINVSGLKDNGIGTNPIYIQEQLRKSNDKDFIIVCDLGSALLSAVVVKESNDDLNIAIAKGPFLETAFVISSLLNAQLPFEEYISMINEPFIKEI